MAHGQIILLNGSSSSGKTTLARQLQADLEIPFLHFSSDQLVDAGALPHRRDPVGAFAWVEQMRPRFFDGFHRCIPALAFAGNNLIVDHIIEYRQWRDQLGALLSDFDVFLRRRSLRRGRVGAPRTAPRRSAAGGSEVAPRGTPYPRLRSIRHFRGHDRETRRVNRSRDHHRVAQQDPIAGSAPSP